LLLLFLDIIVGRFHSGHYTVPHQQATVGLRGA